VNGETLDSIDRELEEHSYLTHEFGDSIFVEEMAQDKQARKRKLPRFRLECDSGNSAISRGSVPLWDRAILEGCSACGRQPLAQPISSASCADFLRR
jgi:hypothetical protein